MAKKMTYAKRVQWEKTPVVDGTQYRAADVGLAVNPCPDCAAFNNDTLCNALGAPAAIGDAGVGKVVAVADWLPNVPGAQWAGSWENCGR